MILQDYWVLGAFYCFTLCFVLVREETFDLTFFKLGGGVGFRTILFMGTFLFESEEDGGEKSENGGLGTERLLGSFRPSSAFRVRPPFRGEPGALLSITRA